MGNKVNFTMRQILSGVDQINVSIFDTSYNKVWSGTSPVSGADLEIDLGANGTVGQDVWVYCNNSSIGSESLSKIMGGYSSIEADLGIEYVAQLDGLTKSWQLSEPIVIPANVNYEIGYYISRPVPNDTRSLYLLAYSQGNIPEEHRLALSTGTPQKAYGMGFVAKDFSLNGEGQFTLTHNGVSEVTFINFNESAADSFNAETITIDRLCGPWLGANSEYLEGYIRDFYVIVNGVETVRIPLTNKAQGATQLATVGNVSATMIGYTGNEWVDRSTI